MAVRANVIQIRTEVIDHDHGHWCNTCLLGTGIRALVAITYIALDRMLLGTRVWCPECGGRNVALVPDAHHC